MEAIDALLADCDGWVVTELLKFGRADLDGSTDDAIWTWSTAYPGTESPDGCGDSSHYIVSYEVASSPPAVEVPDLLSMEPEKVPNALAQVGLAGHETGTRKGNVDNPEVVTQAPPPGWLALPGSTVSYSVEVPEGGRHVVP
jgi:hypothetical protein